MPSLPLLIISRAISQTGTLVDCTPTCIVNPLAFHAETNCLSEKLLTYALGRGVEYFDRCTVPNIVAETEKDNHKFFRLILEIAHSDPFQKRRAKQ